MRERRRRQQRQRQEEEEDEAYLTHVHVRDAVVRRWGVLVGLLKAVCGGGGRGTAEALAVEVPCWLAPVGAQ